MLFEIGKVVGGVVGSIGASKVAEAVLENFITEEMSQELIIKVGKFCIVGAVGVAGGMYVHRLMDEAKGIVDGVVETVTNAYNGKKEEESKPISWDEYVKENQDGES